MADSGQLGSIVNKGGSVELGCRVGVVTVPESANIEDNMAYSRLAASDPNASVNEIHISVATSSGEQGKRSTYDTLGQMADYRTSYPFLAIYHDRVAVLALHYHRPQVPPTNKTASHSPVLILRHPVTGTFFRYCFLPHTQMQPQNCPTSVMRREVVDQQVWVAR